MNVVNFNVVNFENQRLTSYGVLCQHTMLGLIFEKIKFKYPNKFQLTKEDKMEKIRKISKDLSGLDSKYFKRIAGLSRDLMKEFFGLLKKHGITLCLKKGKGHTKSPELCLLIQALTERMEAHLGFEIACECEKQLCEILKNAVKEKD